MEVGLIFYSSENVPRERLNPKKARHNKMNLKNVLNLINESSLNEEEAYDDPYTLKAKLKRLDASTEKDPVIFKLKAIGSIFIHKDGNKYILRPINMTVGKPSDLSAVGVNTPQDLEDWFRKAENF